MQHISVQLGYVPVALVTLLPSVRLIGRKLTGIVFKSLYSGHGSKCMGRYEINQSINQSEFFKWRN